MTKKVNRKSLDDGLGGLYQKYMYTGWYTRGYVSTIRLPSIFIQTPPNENVITALTTTCQHLGKLKPHNKRFGRLVCYGRLVCWQLSRCDER